MFEHLKDYFIHPAKTETSDIGQSEIMGAADLVARFLGKVVSDHEDIYDISTDYTANYKDAKILIKVSGSFGARGWTVPSASRVKIYLRGGKGKTLVFDNCPESVWDYELGCYFGGCKNPVFHSGRWVNYLMNELLPQAQTKLNELLEDDRKKKKLTKDKLSHINAVNHEPIDDRDLF